MTGVPSNILIPFIGVDFDASQAFSGSPSIPIQALLIGQMISAGTGTAETKYIVSNADEVRVLGGAGSQIHKMAQKFFANSTTVPCQIIMLADAGGAAAATQVITIGGTKATAAGELVFYFDGERVAVSVAIDDTPTIVGDALVAAVALLDAPAFTLVNVAGTVTRTAKNKGVAAGDMDTRINYNTGESVPAGLTVSIAAVTPGTGDPDIQDAIDVIGDEWFQVVAHSYSDATNLAAIAAYCLTQDGPMVMLDQLWYAPKRDTRANLITMGTNTATYNSKYIVTPAWYARLQNVAEGAGAVAGAVAQSLVDEISTPLHRVALAGINALARADRWTNTERNQVAASGISTFTDDNGVQIEALVTMYLKNSSGALDPAYQLAHRRYQLAKARYSFRVQMLTKFPRAMLMDSSENLRPGLVAITPKIGRDEALAWFRQLERDGIVENYDDFKAALVCQRSDSNVNRLEWLLPPDLVNAFMVGSAVVQFKL